MTVPPAEPPAGQPAEPPAGASAEASTRATSGPSPGPAPPPQLSDDPEERDPGLARERTSLAWMRTALSFAALGGTLLKVNVITGLIVLAVAPVIWQLGKVSRGRAHEAGLPVLGATRLFVIAVSIVGVSLLCLVVAIFGKSVPGALR
ncbi:MAG TPA: DUF202 domain-containing protein [Trebonia sp.]|jgi:uncharacterized membrane protein YidH (DUF202 family)